MHIEWRPHSVDLVSDPLADRYCIVDRYENLEFIIVVDFVLQ